MKRLVVVAAALSLLSGWIVPAAAYDKAGHYYSAAVMVRKLLPKLDDANARLIAFCSQLPDEASELDAVEVYRDAFATHPIDWAWWGYSTSAESDLVRRMVTVQQLLHALTGGDTKAVEAVAARLLARLVADVEATTSTDVDRLCALGLGLHFYGDAYAHQSLRPKPWWCHSKDGSCMYPTGRGHADDLHLPDYPLYEGRGVSGWVRDMAVDWLPTRIGNWFRPDRPTVRRDLWLGYLTSGYKHFPKRQWAENVGQDVRKRIVGIAEQAGAGNQYGEMKIRTLLWRDVLGEDSQSSKENRYAFEVLDRHGHEPCQDVLTRFTPQLKLGKRVPVCRRVWSIYAAHAQAAFCDDGTCDQDAAKKVRAARDDYGEALRYPDTYIGLHFPLSEADLDAIQQDAANPRPPAAPEPDKPAVPPGPGDRQEISTPTDDRKPQDIIVVIKDPRQPASVGPTMEPIVFETGSSDLEPGEVGKLTTHAASISKALADHPDWWLHVRGHADERGDEDFNRRLSMTRAVVVADWLVGDGKLSTLEGRTIVSGFGEAAPFCRSANRAETESAACWEANRTVRLTVGPLEDSQNGAKERPGTTAGAAPDTATSRSTEAATGSGG